MLTMGRLALILTASVVVISSLSATANGGKPDEAATIVARFGIVTDVHYADADPAGTRHYRDSLPKIRHAVRHMSREECQFVVELGDFKDTNAGHNCTRAPSAECTRLTLGYLRRIERAFRRSFRDGPRYHLLGNHEVDVLNQTQVIDRERDGPVLARGPWPGVYSFSPASLSAGSMNLLGVGPSSHPLRFIALNGDFTADGTPWQQLDFPPDGNAEKWNDAHVPPDQLSWLATQLDAAAAASQRVIVFVHYRLDGGPSGPAGHGLGPPLDPGHKPVIDNCSLRNAAAVRQVLEVRHPGLVLATFSGHDHIPDPPWTKVDASSPVYWTHAAMVEGSWRAVGGRINNAYSVVEVSMDCTVTVRGYGNATSSARLAGPPGCNLSSGPALGDFSGAAASRVAP